MELIAHVVENDLPYTEILTADYIMANPMADEAYGGTADFDDPTDVHEFRPTAIASYYRNDDSKEWEYTFQFGTHVTEPGNLATVYPHAGILNTTVFLKRYPTTATNRNRARSRWTYYHFLGLDVEKSASRTTDAVALADTNNPTMNNPACTVCHTVLDPVAGAFQNYDDIGYYRSGWGGMDSLDDLYKDGHTQSSTEVEVEANSTRTTPNVVTVSGWLAAGTQEIGLGTVNTIGSTNIHVDYLTIRDDSGTVVQRIELEEFGDGDRNWDGESFEICCEMLIVPIDVPSNGTYAVEMSAWLGYQSDEAEGRPGTLSISLGGPFYRRGDTWYRDMRTPGFGGELAPDAINSASLQWLANQIIADHRFANATVKFWWPAIMGNDIAEPPGEGDADFDGRLLASNAQAAEVARLAAGFRDGFGDGEPYNLRDLLTEIVLSQWFRASSTTDDDLVRAEALSVAGGKRLLGPEELARKTLAVTGFGWQRRRPSYPWWNGGLIERSDWADRDSYGLIYGGIDSGGIAERARDITAVMGGLAKLHGAAVACPVTFKDFYLADNGARQIFGGVNRNVSPAHEFGAILDVDAESPEQKQVYSIQGTLQQGRANAVVSLTNELWDAEARGHLRQLYLDKIVIRDDSGSAIETREFENLEHSCAWDAGDAIVFWDSCPVSVPFDVPTTGSYDIEVTAWAEQDDSVSEVAGDEFAKLEIVLEGDTETSVGAGTIKEKLTELYWELLGVTADSDAPEIEAAYELFVKIWESARDTSESSFDMRCDWHSDQYYFDGIVDDAWLDPELGEEWDWDRHGWDRDQVQAYLDTLDLSDRHHVVRTWGAMLAYLLTDYRYLYL